MVTKKHQALTLPEAGRRQRRREETSERIFTAAMELFARKGLSATTVEEITRAADVGKGTFFNYFSSKEHVLGFLIGKQMGVVEQHLAMARDGKSPSDAVLLSLGRNLVKLPGKSPQMARSLIATFMGSPEVRENIVRNMTKGRRLIAEMIHLGQAAGEVNSELSAADLARVYQHALFGTVVLWALDPSSSLEKQFDNTMRAFLSGLSTVGEARPGVRGKAVPKSAARKGEPR